MRKIAFVPVRGGLGNQIFIYNFIKQLENKNFKVFVSNDFYDTSQNNSIGTLKRSLYLDFDSLKVKTIKSKVRPLFLLLLKYSNSQKGVRKKIIKKIIKIFVVYINDNNVDTHLRKKKIIYMFDGYWQDYSLLLQKDFLLNKLKADSKFSDIDSYKKSQGSTALHVRRQDYLDINENLNISYYEKAILYCSENITDFSFTVYTDDINWVKNQKIFNKAEDIIDAEIENTVEDFVNITKFSNFIISNSTYSYMAAYLGTRKNTTVIAPKPWFKTLEYVDYDKILNLNWVLLENEK